MREKSTETVGTSSPTWETLEAFARQSMQQLLQQLLEDEVDGLLGRGRYARRAAVVSATRASRSSVRVAWGSSFGPGTCASTARWR